MTKYSVEAKLKIVQEYIQVKGGKACLSKKYGVKSEFQIGNWINAYHEFCEEKLLRQLDAKLSYKIIRWTLKNERKSLNFE